MTKLRIALLLLLASVTQAASPTVSFVPGAFGTATGISVVGTHAVVTGQTPQGKAHLWVLDVANHAAPVVLGEVPTTIDAGPAAGFLGVGLNAPGTLAVVAMGNAGLWSIDLTNPAAPQITGTLMLPSLAYAVALSADATLAYVACGAAHLQVVNIGAVCFPAMLHAPFQSN